MMPADDLAALPASEASMIKDDPPEYSPAVGSDLSASLKGMSLGDSKGLENTQQGPLNDVYSKCTRCKAHIGATDYHYGCPKCTAIIVCICQKCWDDLSTCRAHQVDLVKRTVKRRPALPVYVDYISPTPTKDDNPLIHALKSHNDDLTTFHAGDVTLLSAHTYLGYTPLHFAAHLGLVSGASILLSHGALINSRDNYNQTPLIIAICLNQSKIVSLLLQHSANIHSVTGINETMALHAAAASGFAHFVSLLLENGAIIDTPSGRGTALQLACRINAFECASILLEKGGNPNDRSALAEPPIVSAVRSRNAELVDLLMKYGTNIDLPYQGKDYAYTALYLAVSLGYQDMARRLLGHGADVNGPGGKDTPCLSRAVALGWLEMTRILIDSGADLDRENKLGMNAIVFAALLGREEIIEILLEKGASAKPPKLCRGKWKTMERYWKGCHCKHVTKETKSRILKKLRAAKHQ